MNETAQIAFLRRDPAVQALVRNLTLGDGFALFILLCEPGQIESLLLALQQECAARDRWLLPHRVNAWSGGEVEIVDSKTAMACVLERLVRPDPEMNTPDALWVLDATAAILVERSREREIWIDLFERLNERRNHIQGALKSPLLICLTKSLFSTFAAAAPDLWSIRSGTFEVQYRSASAESPATRGSHLGSGETQSAQIYILFHWREPRVMEQFIRQLLRLANRGLFTVRSPFLLQHWLEGPDVARRYLQDGDILVVLVDPAFLEQEMSIIPLETLAQEVNDLGALPMIIPTGSTALPPQLRKYTVPLRKNIREYSGGYENEEAWGEVIKAIIEIVRKRRSDWRESSKG